MCELTQKQREEIKKEILKILPLTISPEVIEEAARIKRLHEIEWERIKYRPFTI